ncbi:MAG: type II secretion system F family protein [Patescibacteria group bacterium]
MSIYKYRAKSKKNDSLTQGLVEAETESIAVDILSEKDLLVLSLEEKKKTNWLEGIFNRIKTKDLVIFSRQLSIMIDAEVPLVEAMKNIVPQTKSIKLKKILGAVTAEVEGGIKLSESLARYEDVFDNFFVNIVKSGEYSGRLNEVLLYLADQLEKDFELKSKIKGAMIYPIFVVSGLIIIGILMLMFVVPNLTDMLTQTGAELPFSTKLLKGTSDFLLDYWWLLLLGLSLLVGSIIYYKKTPQGLLVVDKLKLKIPIFGKIVRNLTVVRFARSLRTLMLGGVGLVTALGVASSMMGNEYYRRLVSLAREKVEGGGKLAEVFLNDEFVPKMVGQMLETGEASGKVELVLKKISEFYTREVNNSTRNIMSLLEPVIMVVLGLAVALMIMAVILPMYQISSNM